MIFFEIQMLLYTLTKKFMEVQGHVLNPLESYFLICIYAQFT